PRQGQGEDGVRVQDPPWHGGWVFVPGHHILGCLQRGEPPFRLRRKLPEEVRVLSRQSPGGQTLLYPAEQEMAKGKGHKTGGQAFGKAFGQGSGKPRKTGGEEPDRGEVWPGKERLWDEPDK